MIEGERIANVPQQALPVDDAERIDAGGRVVLPGLRETAIALLMQGGRTLRSRLPSAAA